MSEVQSGSTPTAGTRPSKHGLRGYIAGGCRCTVCCSARADWWADYAARKLADPATEHGREPTYRYGCRCEACRAAKKATR